MSQQNENDNGSEMNRESSGQNNETNGSQNADQKINPPCSICKAQITNRAFAEPCHHSFCFECIRQWTLNRNTCPLCRQVCTQITHNYRSPTDFDRLPVRQQPQHEQGMPLEGALVCVNLIGGCQIYTQLLVPGFFISTGNTAVSIFRRRQSMLLNINTVYHFMNFFGDEALVKGEEIEPLYPFIDTFERLRIRQLFLNALASTSTPPQIR